MEVHGGSTKIARRVWVNTMIQLDVMPSFLCSSLIYLPSDLNEFHFQVTYFGAPATSWQQQPKYNSHSISFMINKSNQIHSSIPINKNHNPNNLKKS